jgi:transcriptional regulator with XRE-family HTH domain
MSNDLVLLTLDARRALNSDQRRMGELLGVSRRTVQRWDSGRGGPSAGQLARLASAVHPLDAALAGRIAGAAGTTLVELGRERPAPPVASPVAAPPPPSPPSHLTDAVVCAAAEALEASPTAVRPVLLAAFRRAHEVGLRVEQVEEALDAAIATASGRKRRPTGSPRPG